ncbi:MAG: LacI family DNA-binding transcriptional regulator [Salinisphaera sp.]|jgi:DNA-binding LacI/PurR family transcriptional regulator|nr:LacI family DNA-binding transcriptional regulator [Salinisphaera sp.]
MRITLKDVAKRAGVSSSAVSRTFTESASVSQKTRKKVMRVADELGYRPNVLAGSLKTQRTKLIGLVADNLQNPVFVVIIDLFTSLIQENGFRPLLVNLAGETDPESSVRLLRQYSVDGVIVASSTLPTSFAVAFHDAGLPVVHTFGRYSGESHAHVVSIDNVHCGSMAASALLDHGYERIGFMGGPAEATSTEDRLKGFESTARQNSMKVSCSFARAYSYEAGREEMSRLIAEGDLAQAYFCGDDVLSIGAMDALADAGLKVPGDVGIIGLNDAEMAGWRCIQLTTIAQPVAEIISASVELIVSQINNPTAISETRLWPCQIKYRSTLRYV